MALGLFSIRPDFIETFEDGGERIAMGSLMFDEWTDASGYTNFHETAVPDEAVLAEAGTWEENGSMYGKDAYELDGEGIRVLPRYYTMKYIDREANMKDEKGSNLLILRYNANDEINTNNPGY